MSVPSRSLGPNLSKFDSLSPSDRGGRWTLLHREADKVRYCLLFVSFLVPFIWTWLDALYGHGFSTLFADPEIRQGIWFSARISAGMGLLVGGGLAFWAPFFRARTLETFTFSLVTSVLGGVASAVLCLFTLALSGLAPGLDPSLRVSLFLGLYLWAVLRMIRWEEWLTAWGGPGRKGP